MPKIPLPEDALDLYLKGRSLQSVARQFQMTPQTLARRLREQGVAVRTESLSAVPVEEVCRRYQQGESAKEIARDAGVSAQTIQRRLQRAGVHLRGKTKTPQQRAHLSQARRTVHIPERQIRDLHAQRLSCREMADVLGCNEETIRVRLVELGLPRLPGKARPERNSFWRGGYAVDEEGYILKHRPDHPQAVKGYVRMHRLVMEETLGRMLLPGEVVDHRNGDTSDNDPANLRLFPSNAEHLRVTLVGKKKLPAAERERLRQEAVQRARQRVAAILADQGTGAEPSP